MTLTNMNTIPVSPKNTVNEDTEETDTQLEYKQLKRKMKEITEVITYLNKQPIVLLTLFSFILVE
jgi:hypothetical protein